MADGIEFLMRSHKAGRPMGQALMAAARGRGLHVLQTHKDVYVGKYQTLMIYGVGDLKLAAARDRHVAGGGVAIIWDIGYFRRAINDKEFMRVSIDVDHPHLILDKAPDDVGRWKGLGMRLTEEHNPDGPIVLVGLGWKSRIYAREEGPTWEYQKIRELRCRFPGREIIHRPKPNPRYPYPDLGCRVVEGGPIEDVIRGASLLVCRHSNAAVDAIRMGIPFECEGGAALWFRGKPYDRETRAAFVRKLAWWQWKPAEADAALDFVTGVAGRPVPPKGTEPVKLITLDDATVPPYVSQPCGYQP